MQESNELAFREVPPGERLFAQGDEADGAYLIAGGSVEVRRRTARGIEVSTLTAGDIVGEMALFTGGRRSADAVVRTRAALIFLSRAEFEQRIEAMDPVMRQIARILVRRVLSGVPVQEPA